MLAAIDRQTTCTELHQPASKIRVDCHQTTPEHHRCQNLEKKGQKEDAAMLSACGVWVRCDGVFEGTGGTIYGNDGHIYVLDNVGRRSTGLDCPSGPKSYRALDEYILTD